MGLRATHIREEDAFLERSNDVILAVFRDDVTWHCEGGLRSLFVDKGGCSESGVNFVRFAAVEEVGTFHVE